MAIPSRKKAAETLQRLSVANERVAEGPGVSEDHMMPLCRYHNRIVAAKLKEQLQRAGIAVRAKKFRLYVEIFVDFNQRDRAFEVLEQFRQTVSDTKPRKFSRDYDIVFLIAGTTLLATAITAFSPLGGLVAIAVFTTGLTVCVVVERIQRQYRYRVGKGFALWEILLLVTLVAINAAIWHWVV